VLEVIQRSTEFLAKRGLDSPRLQVELLLAHALARPRMRLYLDFERELSPAELEQVRELVRRRAQREPLQHILGTACFCGLDLLVNRFVLVPRPETEQLAELGWEFLNGLRKPPSSEYVLNETAPPYGSARTALDFGTGSGCLAIALAVKSPQTRVAALDVSAEALAIARENAAKYKVQERIEFLLGDGFAALQPGRRFDLIVANPPYVASDEIATLEPEVRDHDPRLALNGGADGLDFYRRLAREAGDFLRPDGRMMLEFGDGQAQAVQKIFEAQKWIVDEVKADYTGRPRMLAARTRETSE
jgi:release factor glutamine methyltransferase